jgi:hypothetical protein
LKLISGDQVRFQGGQTYNVSSVVGGASGLTILRANVNATAGSPAVFGSYGTGNAIFSDAGNGNTFQIGAAAVQVDHITFNSKTAKQAIQWLNSAANVLLDGAFATNLTVNGYTRDAIQFVGNVGTSGWNHFQAINNTIDGTISGVLQQGIYANGVAVSTHTNFNCLIQGNIIHDVQGTPATPGGASGNGILLTETSGCDVRSNLTYNIGVNNTTCGGPVGQWAYQSDHITIEYGEAYNIRPNTPTITAASWAPTYGGQITFTLATPLTSVGVGGSVAVNGMLPAGYNTGTGGGYTILAGSTPTSLIVAKTSNPGPATGFGLAYPGFACDWDGFDFDDFVSDSVMQYNYSHDNFGIGILYFFTQRGAPTHGNNIIRFNIAESPANAFGSAGIVIGTNGSPVLISPSYIYNNTVYGSNSTYSCFFSFANVSGVTVANNICNAKGAFAYAVQFASQTSTSLVFIGNDYFVQSSAVFVRWGAGFYASLAAWQTATGEEQISGVKVGTTANPGLVSGGSGGTCSWTPPANTSPQPCPSNYQLLHGSPMIGLGLTPAQVGVADFGTHDYFNNSIPHATGTGWNIGADGTVR